jgi:hypothetical protein
MNSATETRTVPVFCKSPLFLEYPSAPGVPPSRGATPYNNVNTAWEAGRAIVARRPDLRMGTDVAIVRGDGSLVRYV